MFAQPCVFAKQLPGPILCASPGGEDPLSRSYGVSLPSSLAMNLSTPQYVLPGYLCRFAVRVPHGLSLAGFLGSMVTCTVTLPRGGRRTLAHQLGRWTCLPSSKPKRFNVLFRQHAAVSLLRHRIARASSNGILTVSPSASAKALALGPDLPRGDWRCPGNLSLMADGDLTRLIVTYTYICVS